jgi:RimJ/RimL family protein N-acetyltransferase
MPTLRLDDRSPWEHQDLPNDGFIKLALYQPDDAVGLRELDADPEHRRRFELPDDFVPSLDHSRQVIADWTRACRLGEQFAFAVRDAKTGELLGGCELRPTEEFTADLSYWTMPKHRSRGVASRAAALACEIAASTLGLIRVEIAVDADNYPSHRVAVRNGFRESGARSNRILYVKEL